jgi:hypothetical protein
LQSSRQTGRSLIRDISKFQRACKLYRGRSRTQLDEIFAKTMAMGMAPDSIDRQNDGIRAISGMQSVQTSRSISLCEIDLAGRSLRNCCSV